MGAGECKVTRDLTDKVVIITGANSGIGAETAKGLAQKGATIVLATRNKLKTQSFLDEMQQAYGKQRVVHFPLDLADLDSVRQFAKSFKLNFDKLDILINNAGVITGKKTTTKQGFESQFGVNHLGHFLLTNLLLGHLKKAEQPRVINVSSLMHNNCYGLWVELDFDDLNYEKKYYLEGMAHSQSKLANVMMIKELQRRMREEGIDMKCLSLHPGYVATNLGGEAHLMTKAIFKMTKTMAKNAAQGAQTTLYCALEEHDKLVDGGYYADCKIAKENKFALKENKCYQLWEVSEKLVGLK